MKNKFLLYFPRIFLKPENCIFPRKNKKKHIFINKYKNILLVSISKFYFEIGVNKNAKRCVVLIIFCTVVVCLEKCKHTVIIHLLPKKAQKIVLLQM